MRYHKPVEANKPEADHIIKSGGRSITDTVVLSHMDSWYDVRAMTAAEIEGFRIGFGARGTRRAKVARVSA